MHCVARERSSRSHNIAIFIRGEIFHSVIFSLDLRDVSEIELVEWSNGTGTITFDEPLAFSSVMTRSFHRARLRIFEAIPDARTVYDQVRAAQSASRVVNDRQ